MPNGPPIPENLLEPLPTGNYGCYYARWPRIKISTPDYDHVGSGKKPQPMLHYWNLQGDTDLWMFPPAFYRMCLYPSLRDDYKRIPEFFETASNAAFLHKDLILFFLDNTFSIDVDDHHRVLIFRDMGPAQHLLPSHLQVSANEGPDEWYL
ncbi:uncharacterized protein ARMOST_02410 [Armillaria ostoyae]|uniref:Uncharacterized protein n=1 Tax=Armillaria ostoyae TaxID=47428 RepID=A0A284QRT7_ARMOS|nr:uncharacterized protein ARMOST_02410 [Armillaria ostoyae]